LKTFEQVHEQDDLHIKPETLLRCCWLTLKRSFFCSAFLRLLADFFALAGPISINYLLLFVDQINSKNISVQNYPTAQEQVQRMILNYSIELYLILFNLVYS